jgi:hypothetical protein
MKTVKIALWPVSVFSGLILASCATFSLSGGQPPPPSDPANGERIYFTGISGRGGPITFTGGPNFGGMMMGAYLTWASCHGPEGQGGEHQMHMFIMDAPDIRYSALSRMPEMKDRQQAYSLDDFRLAVEKGQDPVGEELDQDMPRWRMSEADLQDLYAFVKSLP